MKVANLLILTSPRVYMNWGAYDKILLNFFSRLKITKNHISAMFKVYFPESYAEGYYHGEGRFNNLKLKSKGFFNVTASK